MTYSGLGIATLPNSDDGGIMVGATIHAVKLPAMEVRRSRQSVTAPQAGVRWRAVSKKCDWPAQGVYGDTNQLRHVSAMSLIRSKKRVSDHGEVFTPSWLVERMLDQVKGETERIDARFLEPACGSGRFLIPVLQRKLAAVEARYGKSDFERRHYALLALMSIYGIELLSDNIKECRASLLEVLTDYLRVEEDTDLFRAGFHVLSQNLVHADALTMRALNGQPIIFAEWGYLGRGKFQRRDFRLDILTGSSAFSAEGSLFSRLGKHELFTPTKSYTAMTVKELADAQ